MSIKNFALVGAAGYIAPRHMKAIKDTGNRLVTAVDTSDSVGVLDRYFMDVDFFTEFERFDRHTEKLRREGEDKRIHYVSICSPNYFHDAHIRYALRVGAHAICEKPLVLNPWNIDALSEIEDDSPGNIYNILQLRVHPTIMALKEKIDKEPQREKHEIDLTYITSRGKWYYYSWKGALEKSGGVATNIGIHFFDMLSWVFGKVESVEIHYKDDKKVGGYLELEKARVRWYLSLDNKDLPKQAVDNGMSTFRSILLDGHEIEFSGGFTDLHTVVYEDILSGRGYRLEDVRPSVELAYNIRHMDAVKGNKEKVHPFCLK
jgi:UDP-N-acetyl-2-amino-2-deoxyglucuronate dehydrogenase